MCESLGFGGCAQRPLFFLFLHRLIRSRRREIRSTVPYQRQGDPAPDFQQGPLSCGMLGGASEHVVGALHIRALYCSRTQIRDFLDAAGEGVNLSALSGALVKVLDKQGAAVAEIHHCHVEEGWLLISLCRPCQQAPVTVAVTRLLDTPIPYK